MSKYSLVLEGASKRTWDAQVVGSKLTITAGTAKTPGKPVKTSHGSESVAMEALHIAMLAKLRAGYALAAPSGAMVGALGLTPHSRPMALSPDGTKVWSVLEDSHGDSIVRIYALASAKLIAEHKLPDKLGRVSDLRVHAATRALLATEKGVIDFGEDGKAKPWSREIKSPSLIDVAGDRAIVAGKGEAVLCDLDARVIARIAKVAVAALSADGALLVVTEKDDESFDEDDEDNDADGKRAVRRKPDAVLRVIDTRKGKELKQLSLGKGSRVQSLAIAPNLVVAANIWFAGAHRHSTWCWALPSGKRAMKDRFPDEHDTHHGSVALGAGGALLALAWRGGHLEVTEGADVRLESSMFGRTGRGHTLRAVGPWMLSYDSSGAVAVWDFERMRGGAPDEGAVAFVAGPSKEEIRAIRAAKGREARTTPRPDESAGRAVPRPFRAGVEVFTLPLGRGAHYGDWVPGGVVYKSVRDEHTTFVELTAWPPAWVRRPQVVVHHARRADGRWLIDDRDGLWVTDHFGDQGQALPPPPLEIWELGWLGDAPIAFDDAGAVPPQVYTADGWKPVTGLVKADAGGGTGVIPFGDAPDASIVTFRGGGYRVNAALRGRRVVDVKAAELYWSMSLQDGRCVSRNGRRLRVFSADLSYVDYPVGGTARRHRAGFVDLAPRGRLVVTYAAPSGPNLTPETGALVGLDGTRPQLLTKAQFGLADAKQISELLGCGDRILARIADSGTFRAIPLPAVASPDAPRRRR